MLLWTVVCGCAFGVYPQNSNHCIIANSTVYLGVVGNVYVCVYMWHVPHLIFRVGHLLNLEFKDLLDWLANELQGSIYLRLPTPRTGILLCADAPSILSGRWRSELLTDLDLQTESSTWSLLFLFLIFLGWCKVLNLEHCVHAKQVFSQWTTLLYLMFNSLRNHQDVSTVATPR